jgi:anti-anti-sigma factor
MSTAPILVAATSSLTSREGAHLTVDLGEVTHLGSSGITALLALQRDLESRKGSLEVRCPPGIVARVLRLAGMSEVLGVDVE